MNIQTLIPRGEWRGNGEYVIRCPFCGDSKSHNHLSINVVEGIFHCFFCGEGGRIQKLFRKLGIETTGYVHSTAPVAEVRTEIDFQSFASLSSLSTGRSELYLAKEYLRTRDVNQNTIMHFDLRYCPDPESKWYGRVLVPVKEHDRVVCFVARSYLEFVRPKYLYPHRGETLLTAGECIFTTMENDPAEIGEIVLVEGVFDALSVHRRTCSHFPIALMGKTLKDPQLYKILKYSPAIPITTMLDADAPNDNLKLAKQLTAYGRKVKVASLSVGDPDSASPEELEVVLENAKPFSFELEMKMKIGRL